MAISPLAELETRNLVAQVSDRERLAAHLGEPRTLYSGFDPTADSLHIGNLVPLLTLRRFQLAGHRPIALIGGATGLIGDPSFKNDERVLNDRDVVAGWVEGIRRQVSAFIDLDAGALVVDNLDWTRDLDVVTYLRDIGKHFSINAMLNRESIRARLDRHNEGISYAEFSYMVLQAMDFLELARRYDCSIQIGGSDQWGNIVGGVDLVRRALRHEAFALTVPLITKADGTKFGKTEAGTIWLDARRTSPYSFYQFWLNTADKDAIDYLGAFTFLDGDARRSLAVAARERPERREAQRALAGEVTRLVHGADGLASAERITAALFEGAIDTLTPADFDQLRLDGIGSTTIGAEAGLLAVLADCALAPSRGGARKLVAGKGISVNGRTVTEADFSLRPEQALHGRYHLIRRGKKHWHLAVHGD